MYLFKVYKIELHGEECNWIVLRRYREFRRLHEEVGYCSFITKDDYHLSIGPIPEAASTESDHRIRSDLVGFGQIRLDSVGFCQASRGLLIQIRIIYCYHNF